MKRFLPSVLTAVIAAALAPPVVAQTRDVPYWASIRAGTANMRVGPGRPYPVDWIYRRAGLPLKVVRVMQGWRLVRDPDGTQGWIASRLLSRERYAIVIGDGVTALRSDPSAQARINWRVEPGVVGRLGDCRGGWCAFDVAGRNGWLLQSRIWGAGEP